MGDLHSLPTLAFPDDKTPYVILSLSQFAQHSLILCLSLSTTVTISSSYNGRPNNRLSSILHRRHRFLQPHCTEFLVTTIPMGPTSSVLPNMASKLHWWCSSLLHLWFLMVLLHLLLETQRLSS
jgi:hypothetical protein